MPIHRPQTRKPPQGTPLASNALTRGLVFAAAFNEGSGVPWARTTGGGYAQPDAGIAGTPSWAASPAGLVYELTNAGLAYSTTGAAAGVQAATALTVLWSGVPNGTIRSDLISQWGGPSTNYRFLLTAGVTAGSFSWYGVNGGAQGISAPYTAGRPYTCVGTLAAAAGSQAFYVNGTPEGTGTGAIGPGTTTPLRIGSSPDAATPDFGTSLVLIWARVLSAAEIAAASASLDAIWPLIYDERPYYRLLRAAATGRPAVYDYLTRRRRAV